jgi:hypothetical protein
MWGDTGRYVLVPVNTTTCKIHTHTSTCVLHIYHEAPPLLILTEHENQNSIGSRQLNRLDSCDSI